MKIFHEHSWEVSPQEARKIQLELKSRIDFVSRMNIEDIDTVAAADISYHKHDRYLYAAVALFSFSDLKFLSSHSLKMQSTFPYIPGYLSFREAPPIIEIFRKIDTRPDVLLCDGQGIAHPRHFGLASHLGLLLDIPTIGCAKSVLVGEYEEPPQERGAASPLIFKQKKVGEVLRTSSHVKPVFVSPGHKISFEDAHEIILRCSPRFRIPEPLRVAHKIVNEIRLNDISDDKFFK
ncbi:MAG: deoxyribonuclease V [Calditrichaeota bacterium]|nr:deoxyribonuclease V [Calditrichota bacterium]